MPGAAIAGPPPLGVTAQRTTLQVWPSMSAEGKAVFLLHTASEIEHMLMLQYLYAATTAASYWSANMDAQAATRNSPEITNASANDSFSPSVRSPESSRT